ncbi:PAC2 family protein [Candidatus Woesearchaeota archaeon]|nr:PAC2 family protein [Candidatus Woesearchaeota archaeon]
MSYNFVRKNQKTEVNEPIIIAGLPGIGNVGKIAVDFLIEELKAKKIYDIYSDEFPNAVFVNEKNLVEMPTIELFTFKIKNQDFVLLAGDVQPLDERGCYAFCESLLELFAEKSIKKVITLGGIGLKVIPEKPELFVTGVDAKAVKESKIDSVREDIYGEVGPIMGVAGLLIGLAARRNIPAVCYLVQTFGHPNYLGIKEARELLNVLSKALKLKVNLDNMDKEIKDIESEIETKTKAIMKLQQRGSVECKTGEVNYIG